MTQQSDDLGYMFYGHRNWGNSLSDARR